MLPVPITIAECHCAPQAVTIGNDQRQTTTAQIIGDQNQRPMTNNHEIQSWVLTITKKITNDHEQ